MADTDIKTLRETQLTGRRKLLLVCWQLKSPTGPVSTIHEVRMLTPGGIRLPLLTNATFARGDAFFDGYITAIKKEMNRQ
jgi:hypothetical protein